MGIIVFDLDGTLADCDHRHHLIQGAARETSEAWTEFYRRCVDDKPVRVLCDLLPQIARAREVQIWSARSDEVRAQTEQWLDEHVFHGTYWRDPLATFTGVKLRMRQGSDKRSDIELKEAWLMDWRAQGLEVDIVFEDRNRVVEMWRSNGVVCAQVALGEF